MLSKTQIDAAQKLYLNGDYAEASINYESLLKKDPSNPYLMTNTANAYYHAGDYGKAIAKYYQAKKYISRDKDLNHNLQMALEEVKLKQPAMLGYGYMTITEAFVMLLLANLFFVFRRKLLPKTALRYLAMVLFVAAALNFSFLIYSQKIKSHAVVTVASAQLRSGNDEGFPALTELVSGQILEISAQDGAWYEVNVAGTEGWLKRAELIVL